ncbi:MAG: baseplate J/gp47 family protein [Acidobacteriia bacterium]|nr:baseplate J/gp47 family protein [Terriglobia bacterium]
MNAKDRLEALLVTPLALNGIDYVEIANPAQTELRVHFLTKVAVAGTITGVRISGGETIPVVPTHKINDATDWLTDPSGRPVLKLLVDSPGDFSLYTLAITSSKLDDFFSDAQFTFKAACPSDFDCKPPATVCPLPEGDIPPIDYLAKDFLSFRKALSDFSALRYPEWREGSEADFGVMFMEALCSLGDDLSYTQDRIAAEATLDTATQRRSIVRHARLVDYEPRPATSAGVLLQFDVESGPIPSGLVVSALGPDGLVIDFETGTGLVNPTTGTLNATNYLVSKTWNRLDDAGVNPNIVAYYWDDSRRCLRKGATEMWVAGHNFNFYPGQQLLLDTAGETTADPHIREIVQLISATEETDKLFNQDVTHLVWRPEDALQFDHDLTRQADGQPKTVLAGNLVPATQGRRYTEAFAIDTAPPSAPGTALAIDRIGPNSAPTFDCVQYLYTLQRDPLVWLAQPGGNTPPLPEIHLTQLPEQISGQPTEWMWRRRLLEAGATDPAFTLDSARFSRIARNGDATVSYDYDDDTGATIRFGDGIFGKIPDPGAVFQVTYRAGMASAGNVATDSITRVDPAAGSLVFRVTNPFPATGGADRETDEQVRRLAPQAFRAKRFFAVRPQDYQDAAQTLAWVARAGTTFRWTGSWLTVFTTADPKAAEQLTVGQHTELINLLNRYRLAGYESYVPAPRFVSLDLLITVCAQSGAFRGDVEAAILAALSASRLPDGTAGFFTPDNFTFGTPLEPSDLDAAIQKAYGVAGVVAVRYRRRGVNKDYIDLTDSYAPRADEILRVDNDPSRPEAGSIKVIVNGGK